MYVVPVANLESCTSSARQGNKRRIRKNHEKIKDAVMRETEHITEDINRREEYNQ